MNLFFSHVPSIINTRASIGKIRRAQPKLGIWNSAHFHMMIAMVSTFAENRVQPVVNSQFQADNKVRIFYDDYDE